MTHPQKSKQTNNVTFIKLTMQAATKIEISTVHVWIVFGNVDDLVLVSVRKKIHIVSAP